MLKASRGLSRREWDTERRGRKQRRRQASAPAHARGDGGFDGGSRSGIADRFTDELLLGNDESRG